jgi:hypothetical protein
MIHSPGECVEGRILNENNCFYWVSWRFLGG